MWDQVKPFRIREFNEAPRNRLRNLSGLFETLFRCHLNESFRYPVWQHFGSGMVKEVQWIPPGTILASLAAIFTPLKASPLVHPILKWLLDMKYGIILEISQRKNFNAPLK